jgi:transcriptional regulator with XRE-family HTH domain
MGGSAPIDSASNRWPPKILIARFKCSMTAFKHICDNKSNTKVFSFHDSMNTVNNLGTRIKEEGEKLGLTQAQLAKKAGVSQRTIGNLESGLRKTARRILGIAKALNQDPEYLVDGKRPGAIPHFESHELNQVPVAFNPTDPMNVRALNIFSALSKPAKKEALDYLEYLTSKYTHPVEKKQHLTVQKAA